MIKGGSGETSNPMQKKTAYAGMTTSPGEIFVKFPGGGQKSVLYSSGSRKLQTGHYFAMENILSQRIWAPEPSGSLHY